MTESEAFDSEINIKIKDVPVCIVCYPSYMSNKQIRKTARTFKQLLKKYQHSSGFTFYVGIQEPQDIRAFGTEVDHP